MSQPTFSEQEIIRREKLKTLGELGIDAYPAAAYPVNAQASFIKANYTEEKKGDFDAVCLAGRIMSIRDMAMTLHRGKIKLPMIRFGNT